MSLVVEIHEFYSDIFDNHGISLDVHSSHKFFRPRKFDSSNVYIFFLKKKELLFPTHRAFLGTLPDPLASRQC